MISLGSRDARREIGLRGSGREMEDTELEEGEACSYHNNGDYDSNIDPDVSFSYLDEKLQDVLGHFQKDFEGGVSAENLGAKFGGYGSFLPSELRSPVCSHSRTPPKGHNFSTSRSPNNLQQEGGHNNSVVSSTTPQSIRPGPPSTSSTSLPVIKGPNLNESFKQEVCTPFRHVEEGYVKNKSTTSSDQKSLKVRLKVGSDNLSTRKNDEIYSGLGLDVSPSSSLDDSPSDSDGIFRELHGGPFESPTSILQMMTSFPVHGGLLLSPLSDDLIHLTQRGNSARDQKSVRSQQYSQESSFPLANGSSSLKGGQMLVEKKTNLNDVKDSLAESNNTNRKDSLNGSTMSKKATEIDACEELVSNALKLPLLANSYSIDEATKDMNKSSEISREANKVVARDRLFFDQMEEDPVEPPVTIEDDKHTNGSSGKVRELKNANSSYDVLVSSKKSGESKREKTIDVVEVTTKGKKTWNGEQIDPRKLKTNHKTASSHGDNNTKYTSGMEHSVPEGKKKSKFSQTDSMPNGELKRSSKSGSSGSKIKSTIKADISLTRPEFEDHRQQKDLKKTKDRYSEFFGELEDDDNPIDMSEFPSEDQLNHSDVYEKRTSAVPTASKERLSAQKIDKSSASEAYGKAFPKDVMNSNGVTIPEAAPAAVDTLSAKDNWVACDKCQQWRLLPLGTNPADLPDNWLCSMLDWLPGMNQCTFSEEETTKALVAKYQAPALGGNVCSNLGGAIPSAANALLSGQNHHNYDLHVVPGGGKKKHGAKERPSMALKGDVPQLSNSRKNEGAMKSRSLDDVNQFPIGDEADFSHLNKFSDAPIEKHKRKQKVKQESLDILPDGGATKSLKTKNRKENEQDYSRPSKKVRTDGMDVIDEDQISVHSGSAVRGCQTLSIDFPSTSGGNNKSKNTDHSLKDSKYNTNFFHRMSKDKRGNKLMDSWDDGSMGGGNDSAKNNGKKKKVKSSPDIGTIPGSLNGSGYLQKKRGPVMELSDNDYRKGKKPKLSKPPGKESSGRKEKKGSQSKNWPLGQDVGSTLSQRSLDGADSLKRDLTQHSLVATSSSSKISGSHKTKSSFQEMKGSPVESVSSSPMRMSNRDKILQSSRNAKDVFQDGGHARCSDAEDGGSDRSGTGSKKKSVLAHHRPPKSPLIDSSKKDASNMSGKKVKAKVKPSSVVPNRDLTNGSLCSSGIDNQHLSRSWALEHVQNESRPNEIQCRGNETYPLKYGKDSSSQFKDKNGSSSDFGTDKDKVPCSHDDLQEKSPFSDLKVKNGKHKLLENSKVKSGGVENKYVNGKDGSGKLFSEKGKSESQLKHEGPGFTVDSTSKENGTLSARKNQQQDCNGAAPKRSLSQKNDQMEKVSGKSTLAVMPTSGEFRNELVPCPLPARAGKGNAIEIDASEGNDALNGKKQIRKVNPQRETQQNGSRHSTPNERVAIDAPSPARRDSSNQAATKAIKEAKDLKHLADRFKNSESNLESIGLYFQAALKFLYGASLFESSSNESAKHSEVIQSISIYSSTAKLCEFCAHEYERNKDMAAASLAYKCMEVAYMRVIYSSHNGAVRDRHELQAALQTIPSGESPSSSASDVDNLNNPTTADKVAFTKGVGSSQVPGSHVITARNRPNFVRLLSYAQDVNFAMEASRKSRIAFAAANASSEGTTNREISCIKTALDFNFHDIEGLLSLVRVAMEAISR